MKEKIIIIFIALGLGLIITTGIFYLYQTTKTIPKNQNDTSGKSQKVESPTPSKSSLFLSVEEPSDEAIVDRRTIQVKGKTNPDNLIIVSSNSDDIVASPASDGGFSVTINIEAQTNKIKTKVISPTGESLSDEKTVTFFTEDF